MRGMESPASQPPLVIEFEDGVEAAIVIVVLDDGTIRITGRGVTSENAADFRKAISRLMADLEQQDGKH